MPPSSRVVAPITAELPRFHQDDARYGASVAALKRGFIDNLTCVQGRFSQVATLNDYYMALALTVRDRLLYHWLQTSETYFEQRSRTVCYLSAEFLLGPHLDNTLLNLGLREVVKRAMSELGLDLDVLIGQEEEPGLGNGGLGRLAACYMDSLATLQVPSIGYGIRYEFGLFDQAIENGWQVEKADRWLRLGNPWEIARPEITYDIGLGGHTEEQLDAAGRYSVRWVPARTIRGMAYDTPISGFGVRTANLLRLWKAEAAESFDLNAFNLGDYYQAVEKKVQSETLTKVLYPQDGAPAGKRLRLEQQYFFVSCALRDMIRIHLQTTRDVSGFADKYAIQLNDTHPALAVPELMRLLVDEHGLEWDAAWEITRATFSYTNHTLLPEALERWPLPLFGSLLPRHLQIIFEINRRFLATVREQFPGDEARVSRMSLIDESGPRFVRMAHVASVGSHQINGVAALHTQLLRREVLHDFAEMYPEAFSNKTNGVTPRRFLLLSNPRLARLITSAIGERWVTNLDELRALEPLAHDAAFQQAWRQVKQANKEHLASELAARVGITASPDTLFELQFKRIHEYKRQHLNLLHAITLYHRIHQASADVRGRFVPRTILFGGKAAPGYDLAKRMIKLINAVAQVINKDPVVDGLLRVAFFPDYNVKSSHFILPAADLSTQISLAGKEASGTGNMKMALNGALTIGTLDGANVEIREEVGAENFFLFGMTVPEVEALRPGYQPLEFYERDSELKSALDAIARGDFSAGDREVFRPLIDAWLHHDEFMALADYRAYVNCQQHVAEAYADQAGWTAMSILNTARMGKFSSDRAVREYCADIWHVQPVSIAGRGSDRPVDPARP